MDLPVAGSHFGLQNPPDDSSVPEGNSTLRNTNRVELRAAHQARCASSFLIFATPKKISKLSSKTLALSNL